MAISTSVVTVGTTAVRLTSAPKGNRDRESVLLTLASGTVYIGGSDVTSTKGAILQAPGLAINAPTEEIWAVTASGSVDVRIARFDVRP